MVWEGGALKVCGFGIIGLQPGKEVEKLKWR